MNFYRWFEVILLIRVSVMIINIFNFIFICYMDCYVFNWCFKILFNFNDILNEF